MQGLTEAKVIVNTLWSHWEISEVSHASPFTFLKAISTSMWHYPSAMVTKPPSLKLAIHGTTDPRSKIQDETQRNVPTTWTNIKHKHVLLHISGSVDETTAPPQGRIGPILWGMVELIFEALGKQGPSGKEKASPAFEAESSNMLNPPWERLHAGSQHILTSNPLSPQIASTFLQFGVYWFYPRDLLLSYLTATLQRAASNFQCGLASSEKLQSRPVL